MQTSEAEPAGCSGKRPTTVIADVNLFSPLNDRAGGGEGGRSNSFKNLS